MPSSEFIAAAALLLVCYLLYKALRLEWLRYKRSTFRPYAPMIFGLRKLLPWFALWQICDAGVIIYDACFGHRPAGSINYRVALGMDFSLPMAGLLGMILVWSRKQYVRFRETGFLEELKLADARLQSLVYPGMVLLAIWFWIASAIKAPVLLASSELLSGPFFLLLFILRQAMITWCFVCFLYCSLNHGYGVIRTAVLAVVVQAFSIATMAIPFGLVMDSKDPIILTFVYVFQVCLYFGLGRLFLVSFMRTSSEIWSIEKRELSINNLCTRLA